MSWLSNLTSAEGAAALLKQAVAKVESQIDKALDIPQSPKTSRDSVNEGNSARRQPNWSSLGQSGNSAPGSPRLSSAAAKQQRSPRRSAELAEQAPGTARQTAVASKDAPNKPRKSIDLEEKAPGSPRLGAATAKNVQEDSGNLADLKLLYEGTKLEDLTTPATMKGNHKEAKIETGNPQLSPTRSKTDVREKGQSNASLTGNRSTPSEDLEGLESLRAPETGQDDEVVGNETRPSLKESGIGRVPAEHNTKLSSTSIVSNDTALSTLEPATADKENTVDAPDAKLADIDEPTGTGAPTSGKSPGELSSVPKSLSTEKIAETAVNAGPIDLPGEKPLVPSEGQDRLKAVVELREEQLMKSMHENASLTDTVTTLKRQLEQLEELRATEQSDAERKLQDLEAAAKEAKEKLAASRDACASQSSLQGSLEEAMRKLAQKDEMVAQLMLEGERLSKNELKFNTTIKRLRAEKAEIEKERKGDSAKIESSQNEITTLKAKLAEAVDNEKKQADAVRVLNETGERQGKEIKRLQGELETARNLQSITQNDLESLKIELADAKKGASEASAAAQSEAVNEHIRANASLKAELLTARKDADSVQAALTEELQNLRHTLAQKEDEAGWKEDSLRTEIRSLQHRLQDLEAQNHELAATGHESAQPLLRQIELLQSQHASSLRKWEQIERQLTNQLQEATIERNRTVNLERQNSGAIAVFTSKVDILQKELDSSRAEKDSLVDTLTLKDQQIEQLESQVEGFIKRIAQLEEDHKMVLDLSNQNEERLRRELEEERRKLEERSKSVQPLAESSEVPKPKEPSPLQIDIPKRVRPSIKDESRRSSFASSTPPEPRSADLPGVLGSGFNTGAVIERLHATVRHYEGQLNSMRVQLQMAEQGRTEELVLLHDEQEKTTKILEELQGLRSERDDLNTRYIAALELLGEKTERVEELQADINDMKGIFKAQVSELMVELDAAQRK
ncbi:TATA element modulatory factor 1 TATA binding-domain-containing protein [Powellomyces hirtus]|nr:TATA element modulatory factor 1 TATA binding-domain-containing protein [Powellomyces hirtus]